MAIPIRNFNKVYGGVLSNNYSNTQFVQEIKGKKGENNYKVLSVKSVRQALDSKWHTSREYIATDIIDKTIRDLQSPRRSERIQSMSKLQSAWVQATLSANVSVTLKQAASYPTAAAVINGKYLNKAIFDKYAWSHFNELCEEIDEHTGIHYKRRMGMSIQEIAELTKKSDALINKIPAAVNPMKWIQAMDCRTTATLWIAAKKQIEGQNPTLQKGSAEYWNKVTALYEECIEKTQPNYDVLHRAEIQKIPDSFKNVIAMFQTQPLQNTGLIYDSLFEWHTKANEYRSNATQENKTAVIKARNKFANACQSQVVSALVFSAMTLFATALKGKMNKYRDDDEKVTFAEIIKGYFSDFGSTVLNTVLPLFGSTIWEAGSGIAEGVESAVNGDNFKINTYDLFSSPLVSTLNDTATAFFSLIEDSVDVLSGKISTDKYLNSTLDFVEQIAAMGGIPLGNIRNSWNGIKLLAEDAKNGEFGEFEAAANRTISQKMDLILREADGEFKDSSYYEKYADEIYASSRSYDLLYEFLKMYGYNSSRYKQELKKVIEIKKANGTVNPDPEKSLKDKALKEYADRKQNGTYEEAEALRQLCIQLYGSMQKVTEALEKLD